MLGYVVFTQDKEMAEVLVWPLISFAALAFGLDWNGKQNTNRTATDDEPDELLGPVSTFKSYRRTPTEYKRSVRPEQPTDYRPDE